MVAEPCTTGPPVQTESWSESQNRDIGFDPSHFLWEMRDLMDWTVIKNWFKIELIWRSNHIQIIKITFIWTRRYVVGHNEYQNPQAPLSIYVSPVYIWDTIGMWPKFQSDLNLCLKPKVRVVATSTSLIQELTCQCFFLQQTLPASLISVCKGGGWWAVLILKKCSLNPYLFCFFCEPLSLIIIMISFIWSLIHTHTVTRMYTVTDNDYHDGMKMIDPIHHYYIHEHHCKKWETVRAPASSGHLPASRKRKEIHCYKSIHIITHFQQVMRYDIVSSNLAASFLKTRYQVLFLLMAQHKVYISVRLNCKNRIKLLPYLVVPIHYKKSLQPPINNTQTEWEGKTI